MEQTPFSFHFFIEHPVLMLAYALMLVTTLSIWIKRTAWLWAPLLVLSYTAAFIANIAVPFTIFFVVILLLCHLLLHYQMEGLARFFVIILVAIVSLGLNWHLIKGFADVVVASGLKHSASSYPYNFVVNFGTPFIGVFILALNSRLAKYKWEWVYILTRTIPYAVGATIVMLLLFQWFGGVKFELKFTLKYFVWVFFNLILHIMPEEAFYRDFLQRELAVMFPRVIAQIITCVAIAVLFSIGHFLLVPKWSFAAIAFVGSLLYSGIYAITQRVEAAMICRFIVLTIHFWFFTYPIMAA